ncbi:MAG: hypothetical protein IT426_03750 [Pirellulales bacterium]|nr:hypothetical protein [Pirellulales bacterium]
MPQELAEMVAMTLGYATGRGALQFRVFGAQPAAGPFRQLRRILDSFPFHFPTVNHSVALIKYVPTSLRHQGFSGQKLNSNNSRIITALPGRSGFTVSLPPGRLSISDDLQRIFRFGIIDPLIEWKIELSCTIRFNYVEFDHTHLI